VCEISTLGVGSFLERLGIDAVFAAAGGCLIFEQIDQGNEPSFSGWLTANLR
jgi:hypothetical protein